MCHNMSYTSYFTAFFLINYQNVTKILKKNEFKLIFKRMWYNITNLS